MLVANLMRQASIRVNVLLVGALLDEASAGAFNAAIQSVNLGSLFLTSFGLIFAPVASSLYHSQQHEQLQRLFATTTRWMLTLSLPIFAIVSYLALPILGLFGEGFAIAGPAMVILTAGQFINVSVGSTGVLMNMSGLTVL